MEELTNKWKMCGEGGVERTDFSENCEIFAIFFEKNFIYPLAKSSFVV